MRSVNLPISSNHIKFLYDSMIRKSRDQASETLFRKLCAFFYGKQSNSNFFLHCEKLSLVINSNYAILGIASVLSAPQAVNHFLWDFASIISQGRKICPVITRDKAKSGSRLPPLKSVVAT